MRGSISWRNGWLVGCAILAVCSTAACTWSPAPAWPRAELPLPDDVAARYALPEPPRATAVSVDEAGRTHGELSCGDETAKFHFWPAPGANRPVVLIVPILAGGADLMGQIARRMVARGFHAAWCDRVAPAMKPPQRGPDLEHLFRRTVIHQRMLLAHLRADPTVGASTTFVLGVSMGGIVATVVAAVDRDIAGAALCLAGGDLAEMVHISGEGRVQRWLDWRREEDGVGDSYLRWEMGRHLTSDPALMAPFVPVRKVLFVAADFDDVIPRHHRDLLWEALGRPERVGIPLGHYSAGFALDSIMTSIADFFTERLPRDSANAHAAGPAAGPAAGSAGA